MKLIRLLSLVSAALVGVAMPATAQQNTDVTCLLRPRFLVQLGSPVNGVLDVMRVDRGDSVKKGQVVAELVSSVEAAGLALDRARAADTSEFDQQRTHSAMLRRKVERTKQLAGKAIASAVSLDEAENELEESVIKERAAATHTKLIGLEADRSAAVLDLKRIKSSVDGVVVERKLEAGDYVSEQSPIFTIADIDPLNVEMVVPAKLYGTIKVGTIADVEPASPLGGHYNAKVEVVDKVVDAASDTFGVRLILPNPGGRVPAGLRCTVRWHE
jgi:membrane fusion protein (multidrug efflux system)